jgi:hypothetical protein
MVEAFGNRDEVAGKLNPSLGATRPRPIAAPQQQTA